MPLPIILGGAALAAITYDTTRKTKVENELIIQQSEKNYRIEKVAFKIEKEITTKVLNQLDSLQSKISSDFESFHTIADDLLEKLSQNSNNFGLDRFLPQHHFEIAYRITPPRSLNFISSPILAACSLLFSMFNSEKKLDDAKFTQVEVEKAVEKMRLARLQFQEIQTYISKIQEATQKIYVTFSRYLDDLKEMDAFISNNGDISQIEDKTIQVIENGYKVAAILTDIICTPLFKPKTDENGQVVLGEDSSVQIEIDENGLQILNTVAIDKNLSQADIDMEAFERLSA